MLFETTKSLPCANKTVNISAGVSHKKSRSTGGGGHPERLVGSDEERQKRQNMDNLS